MADQIAVFVLVDDEAAVPAVRTDVRTHAGACQALRKLPGAAFAPDAAGLRDEFSDRRTVRGVADEVIAGIADILVAVFAEIVHPDLLCFRVRKHVVGAAETLVDRGIFGLGHDELPVISRAS